MITDAEGEEQRHSEESSNKSGGSGNPNQNSGPGSKIKRPKGTIIGLRMARDNGRFFVSFTPGESLDGYLNIAVASEEKRLEDNIEITKLIDQDGRVSHSNSIALESGKRVRFEVHTKPPLPEGYAINVEATKEVTR